MFVDSFKRILSVAVVMLGLCAHSAINDYDKKGCTFGRWTTDLVAARELAVKSGSPFILAEFMKNDGSCGLCNSVAISVSEQDWFKNWAKENKIPLVIADYAAGSYASQQIDCNQYESFPVFVIIDAEDGKTRLAWFGPSGIMTGNGLAAVTPKPSKGFMITAIKSEIFEVCQRLLSIQNNAAVSKAATGANRHRLAAAFEIEPDDKSLDEEGLVENLLYGVWPNSLSSKHWVNGKKIWAFYEDQFDWWKFECTKAGTSYEIKTPVLDDPLGIGTVCVFTNATQASDAKTYAAATNTAYWVSGLADLSKNGTFTVPNAGDVYILFTRRDVTDYEEDITLDYTFTLQERDSSEFWFEKQVWSADEGETNRITVVRSSSVGAATVEFSLVNKDKMTSVTSVNPADYASAVQGEGGDFYFIDSSGDLTTDLTVSFENGVKRSYVYVVNKRGDVGIQTEDRAFGLHLSKKTSESGRYVDAFVVINDADKEDVETSGPVDATSFGGLSGLLNDEDVEDVYSLTNNASTKGSIYGFSVDFDKVNDFSASNIYVKAVRKSSGEHIALRAGNVASQGEDGKVSVGVGGYAFFLFGSDSDVGGDVEITVSRDEAASGELPTVQYRFAWNRFDRPVVSFESGAVVVARDGGTADHELAVKADSITGIVEYVQEAFELDVGWKTTLPDSEAAEPGVDFASVAKGTCAFTNDASSVKVTTMSRDGVLHPQLSFSATLLDAEDEMYVVDDAKRSVTFTFAADNVAASPSVALDASKGGWQSTGKDPRCLSYTNVADVIKVTGVQSGKFYRLMADGVVIKPAGTPVSVQAYTNGVPAGTAYDLASLCVEDEVMAPVLQFEGLVGDEIELHVQREKADGVFAEYSLSMREWVRPLIRFADVEMEADDTNSVVRLTLLREGNVADAVTVKASDSNETATAVSGYYSLASDMATFAAGSDKAEIEVRVADPEWNAAHWTGDRALRVEVSEVFDIGAFDFAAGSNSVLVVLRETSGSGLDEADAYDDTRDGVTNHLWTVAQDGTVTGFAGRTLNGCAAQGFPVDDTNDWYRFTGIVSGETYVVKWEMDATNADVVATLFVGDAADGVDITDDMRRECHRYLAKSDADVTVRISRASDAGRAASVNYSLYVYKYLWPVVGFAEAEVTVTNTVEAAVLKVLKGGTTNDAAHVEFSVNGFDGRDGWLPYSYYERSIDFGEAQTNADFAVALNQEALSSGLWAGDWKFVATLSVDTNVCRYGAVTSMVVTVVDATEQKDASDPEDDVADGACVLQFDGESLSVTNHLNGIDVDHYGSAGYSDVGDWFSVTNVVGGNTYRLTVDVLAAANDEGLDLSVHAAVPGFETNVAFAAVMEGVCIDVPATEDGALAVCVSRTKCGEEVPVSVVYALGVERIAWPRFSISAESASVRNDAGTAVFVVTRLDNLDADDVVVLTFADTNDVKVVSGEMSREIDFAPGVSAVTQTVDLVAAEDGFWKRGGDFAATLSASSADPYVTIGDPSSATVAVVDASGILENDYPEDDAADGAQEYAFSKDMSAATNYCAAAQAASARGANWLNGADTNDWYRFTGTKVGKRYRFEMSDVEQVNADGLSMAVEVFDADMNLLGKTNLVDFTKWDFEAADADGFYVRVSREACAAKDVSVRYVLSFREASTVFVKFTTAATTVSEAAEAIGVDVVCITEKGESLEQDAVVVVTPAEDPDADYPAEADFDFDPAPVTLTWPAGSTGGVQRATIALANYDTVWEGDETFLLELSTTSDGVDIGAPDKVVVTIVDKDDPAYGTVGITGCETTEVREGGVLPVEFTRVDGDAGAVTGKFAWVVGRVKSEQTVVLFSDREGGTKTVDIAVPENERFALSQSATVTFSLVAAKKTVQITRGTPTKLSLTVLDSNYGGKVSDYSAGDAAKPAFRAAGTAWYAGVDGCSVVAGTPSAGGTSLMSVTLTCPCTLSFDAEFSDAANCELLVKCGATVLTNLAASAEGVSVAVDSSGTKTVQFVFSRPKKGASDNACVSLSNISVLRGDAANRTGTYTGLVEVGGVPGYATMTVSATGKLSCKMTCADCVWTVSGRNPWESGASFQAKSGEDSMTVSFSLDESSGTVYVDSSGTSLGSLSRKCWADRPLSASAAAAIESYVGYYTVSVVSGDAGGYGSGYLGVTILRSGAVKASGVLSDGQSVSMSSTLAIDGAGNATVPLFARPSAYNGGWFRADVALSVGDDGVPVASCAVASWARFERSGDAVFSRAPSLDGGWYDKTDNLYDAYSGGLGIEFESASAESVQVGVSFSESGSRLLLDAYDGGFTVSFARATGLLRGYVREKVDEGGRSVRKSYAYKGILTPASASAAGRGFFLRGGESVDITVKGK